MSIIWGIGIPIFGFIILFKNRSALDSEKTQKYFLMLYQGLKLDRYYWEFINTIRKVLLLCVTIFLSTASINLRALISTIIMITMLRLQKYLSPYKLEQNNILEFNEMTTGAFTIFATMVFAEETQEVAAINIGTFIISKHLSKFNLI
jgi:hypothetical protein